MGSSLEALDTLPVRVSAQEMMAVICGIFVPVNQWPLVGI